MGPLTNLKKIGFFYILEPTVDEQLYQICSTLDEIFQHNPPTGSQAADPPLPLTIFIIKIVKN